MYILRQKAFANKKNKEMVRDWKLRQRIRNSGIVDEINEAREAKVRELTKGQKGFLGFGRPHATKVTEEEIFNRAKGGRRAYQRRKKFEAGGSDNFSVYVGEDPKLFEKVNKDHAARGTKQVKEVKHNINSSITNGGDSFIGNRKSSARRRQELHLDFGGQKYHMSGAEYHAKKAAEKRAAEEAAKATPKPTLPKPTTIAAKEGNKILGWVKKNPGKTAAAALGTAGLAYAGKKAYDHYKNRDKE